MTTIARKDIKNKIVRFIITGNVILADKVRANYNGGGHHLSIGRNTEAVPTNQRYSIISYGKNPAANFVHKFTSIYDAVNWFVDFCGNEIAYDAYRHSVSRTH